MDGKNRAKPNQVIKQISQINKQLHDIDYLRIIMIYFACYNLSTKDKETILKSIQKFNYRDVLINMGIIDKRIAESKKFERRAPGMSGEEFNHYA